MLIFCSFFFCRFQILTMTQCGLQIIILWIQGQVADSIIAEVSGPTKRGSNRIICVCTLV